MSRPECPNCIMPMQAMDEAPTDKLILLRVPAFGMSLETWWPGMWSWVEKRWAVRTPFTLEGKTVMVADIPKPIGWMPLPAA